MRLPASSEWTRPRFASSHRTSAAASAGRVRADSPAKQPASPKGVHVEVESREELERFQALGKIGADEIAGVDLEELSRKLQG